MKHPIGAVMALCMSAALVGCGSDDDAGSTIATAELSVLHASSDAPAVDVDLNGLPFGRDLDFKQSVTNQTVAAGPAEIVVRGILPGTARPTVIGPTRVVLDAGRRYAVLAVNRATALEPLVIARDPTAVPAGAVRLQVVHAAPAAPRVAVYVTAPNASLAASAPAGTFSFKESFGPVGVPAGDYQIRVTLAGNPATVVFDSGVVRLDAGADLLLAAVPNTTTSSSPITLLANSVAGATIELRDRGTPARIRVVHASPDAPAVDVVVNDNFAQPLVRSLAFPTFTPFVEVPGGTYNVKVTPAGNRGVIVINANPTFASGSEYSVFAVGRLAALEPLVLRDDRRRVATQAKVRIVHAAPAAGAVDLYIVARGAAIATAMPAFANVPFKADTGYVGLVAGQYDVVVTPAGSKSAAIGPASITVVASGVYTIAAREAVGGGAPLGVILLDDFAP